MTATEFTYWLQGFMEIQDPEKLDKKQTQIIKDHLALVFNKKTPNRMEENDQNSQLNNEDDYKEILNELDNLEPQGGGFMDIPDCQVALC